MIIRSTNQIKEFNTDAVRAALNGFSGATIAEVVRATRLSVPTVSRIIDEMVASGEALNCPEEVATGGRRARQYLLNAAYSYALCMYFDQNVLWYELSDATGGAVEEGELPVKDFSHPAVMDALVERMWRQYPALKAVSIGAPAWVDHDEFKAIMEYPGFDRLNFRTLIGDKYRLPCRVTNDLKAIVTGYYSTHFAERKVSLCCFYQSCSGPGTGLVVNGRLMPGFAGFAGEIGYLPVGSGNLHDALLPENDYESRTRAAATAVIALITLLNPEYLLFCTYGGRLPAVADIVRICRERLPEASLPEFIETNDYHLYYLKGLRSIASRLIAQNRRKM